MMRFQLILFGIFYYTLFIDRGLTLDNSRSNVSRSNNAFLCIRTQLNQKILEFTCPSYLLSNDVELYDLNSSTLNSIETLRIKGVDTLRGPLTGIPSNICRLPNLKTLILSSNKIRNADFNLGVMCLPELRTLQLSNNFIRTLSVNWFKQMPSLRDIDLSSNNLTDLRYDTFNNLSYLHSLDISRNSLTTIELWTLQVEHRVNYQFNKIEGFSNKYNADLSQIQSEEIPEFILDKGLQIQFNDTIFAMYNRCAEIRDMPGFSKSYVPTLTLALLSILEMTNAGQTFYQECKCEKYYFYRAAFAIQGYPDRSTPDTWICPGQSIPFTQHCANRSWANFERVVPRLCKIHESEPGVIPKFASEPTTPYPSTTMTPSTTTKMEQTTTMTATTVSTTTAPTYFLQPHEIEQYLENITALNTFNIQSLIFFLNYLHDNRNATIGLYNPEETKRIYRRIVLRVENLIESIDSSFNITERAVGLISSTNTNPVYNFNQLILPNSSITYSYESEHNKSTTTISIPEEHILQLTTDKYYSFFYLPSSIFEFAQNDSRIEILSPIVGAHLPIDESLHVQMSFYDNNSYRSSGNYSCAFWQYDRWNDTGCIYSYNSTMNRHYCHCDHLTSFALIFTPDGTLRETFLPTIITSCFSIIGLCLSIILSIYQQTKPKAVRRSRRFSIANVFSLFSTLILFILFIILLIINQQSSATVSTSCQPSMLNLVLAIYFFIILTFVSKTFLGFYYYFTIFTDFKPRLFHDRPNKGYLISLLIIIIAALIPTIIAGALSHQQNDIIISKNNVCWFEGIYLIGFITIPVSLLIGINLIIVILIGISLFQFLCNTKIDQGKEKRLIVAACMWVASCILLGIVWIVGPFLNLLVNENGQSISTTSKGMQWIFALLTGLEGVWILIVNILFYVRQRTNKRLRWLRSLGDRKKWQRIDDLSKISSNIRVNQNGTKYSS